jgi:hypothetical protein
MTRTALLKISVFSAALVTGSSAANAYIRIYSDLTCSYAAAPVPKTGPIHNLPVPTVTIRNIGPTPLPGNTKYTIKHVNPDATIHLTLARSLLPKQQATAPVQANWGKASPCTATAAIVVPISGGGPTKH